MSAAPSLLSKGDQTRLNRFLDAHYGRKPGVLRGFYPLSKEMLFRALAEKCSRDDPAVIDGTVSRLYVENELPEVSDGTPYLPSKVIVAGSLAPAREDPSLEAYFTRVGPRLGSLRFGLSVTALESEWSLRSRFAPVIDVLRRHRKVGVPMGSVDLVAFMGNYRTNPFGLHKDTQHVFTFIAAGPKAFRTWPFEALASHRGFSPGVRDKPATLEAPSPADEERLARSAIDLEGGPGDLFYWPDSYWHRAVGHAEPALTLTLGIDYLRPQKLKSTLEFASTGEDGFADAGKSLRAAQKAWRLAQKAALEGLKLEIVRQRSLQGYKAPVLLAPDVELALTDSVTVSKWSPVAFDYHAPGQLFVASNGQALKFESSKRDAKVLEQAWGRCASKPTFKVGDFAAALTRLAGHDCSEEALMFARMFVMLRAIEPTRS